MKAARKHLTLGLLCLVPFLIAPRAVRAGDAPGTPAVPADLLDLSLDQLAGVEITSVSRHAEKLTDAPSAVFCLGREDIRRSGATTVPEALRLVPGLQVARINANTWAISARGFNERFANKLLVLVDGRTVYSPLFSGVFWDVQTMPLAEIDRIEVIRGPGAAMWGANAVNGVINIITRSAAETRGGAVHVVEGVRSRAASLRYGGALGAHGQVRVTAAGLDADENVRPGGGKATDEWRIGEGSFRADFELDPAARLMVEGGYQRASIDGVWREYLLAPPSVMDTTMDQDYRGGHFLARFERSTEDGSSSSLQGFYDRTDRDLNPALRDVRTMLDIDGTRRVPLGFGALMVGAGFRWTKDDEQGSQFVAFERPRRETRLYSGFLHGEFGHAEDRAQLSLGAKLEHNSYTGLEIQPNVRGLLRLDRHQNLWAAFSRAVRTPSRMESDVHFRRSIITGIRDLPPILATVNGTSRFDAEVLLASELGYRAQPRSNLSFDVAAFYNDYKELRGYSTDSLRVMPVPGGFVLEAPSVFNNDAAGHAFGVEAVVDWHPLKWWRLLGSATLMDVKLPDNPTSAGNNPDHQFLVRSEMNLPHDLEADGALRVVGPLEAHQVPAYTALDLRLGWRPLERLEVDLVGRDLLCGRHLEFVDEFLEVNPTEIRSDYCLKLAWHF